MGGEPPGSCRLPRSAKPMAAFSSIGSLNRAWICVPLLLIASGCESPVVNKAKDAVNRDEIIDKQIMSEMYPRSEEHTSELQSLMRSSYAVLCLPKKTQHVRIKQIINNPRS